MLGGRASTRPAALVCAVVAVLLCAAPAQAWSAIGHLTVAEIAHRYLGTEARAKAEACARVLSLTGPYPLSPDFVQTAPWADDLKAAGLTTMSTWHYVNLPVNPENITITTCPVTAVNIRNVIGYLQDAIMRSQATSEIIVTSLAHLVHFVADVHQPLHAVALFSAKHPKGDNGGNAQTVVVRAPNVKMTLHAFWDSMGRDTLRNPARPLTAAGYKIITDLADELEARHQGNFTPKEKGELNGNIMAQESYDIAVQYVYPGADNGATLTEAYKADARRVAERRVVLAGYRLATIVHRVLKNVKLETINAGLRRVTDDFVANGGGPKPLG